MESSKSSPGGGMGPGVGFAASIERLNRALDMLAAAIEARIDREAALTDAEAEVQRIGADRVRLAESLDVAVARAQRLEGTNREVSRRLVDAMEAIRAVLDGPRETQT
jgi:ABC-type transporter Mla subunit MlaD